MLRELLVLRLGNACLSSPVAALCSHLGQELKHGERLKGPPVIRFEVSYTDYRVFVFAAGHLRVGIHCFLYFY